MAQDIQDDGFHEIQLNGKQLVFLFMAATVVSVVIFLCGVLVGRGVRVERATVVENSPANTVAETTPQQPAPPPAPPAAGSDPTTAPAPAPAGEDLSYFNRLEKQKPPADQLKAKAAPAPAPPVEKPVEKPAPAKSAASVAAPPPAPVAPAAAAPVAEAGSGFAVQIAALNVRTEADAIAKRLTTKGYAAYVVAPETGKPVVFRVRVGKFPTRREAESIAARLQKEEQFKPWVTR